MQQTNFVQFKKERDLGAIITDTFKFLRLEWRGLTSVLINTSLLPFIVVFALSVYSGIEASSNIGTNPFGFNFTFLTLVVYLLTIITYHLVVLSVLSYIKVYVDHHQKVALNLVYDLVKKNILNFSVLGIISFVMILIGTIFCLVPGIYFAVVLSVCGGLFVFDKKPIFDAIGESFSFVNWRFWETFGVVIVLFLLLYVMMMVFSLPNIIYSFVKVGTMVVDQNIEDFGSIFKDPVYLVLAFISNLGQYILYGIGAIGTSLIYFDLNEQKNASGSLEMIDSLGKD